MFINVKIESLKDSSKDIPEIVRKTERQDKDIIKIITDKKYLLASSSLKLILKKGFLFKNIFFGFAWDIRLLTENLNKENIFKKRIPELVEKKDPPMITNIKNKKDILSGVLPKENPKFEILLVKSKNTELKL